MKVKVINSGFLPVTVLFPCPPKSWNKQNVCSQTWCQNLSPAAFALPWAASLLSLIFHVCKLKTTVYRRKWDGVQLSTSSIPRRHQ